MGVYINNFYILYSVGYILLELNENRNICTLNYYYIVMYYS